MARFAAAHDAGRACRPGGRRSPARRRGDHHGIVIGIDPARWSPAQRRRPSPGRASAPPAHRSRRRGSRAPRRAGRSRAKARASPARSPGGASASAPGRRSRGRGGRAAARASGRPRRCGGRRRRSGVGSAAAQEVEVAARDLPALDVAVPRASRAAPSPTVRSRASSMPVPEDPPHERQQVEVAGVAGAARPAIRYRVTSSGQSKPRPLYVTSQPSGGMCAASASSSAGSSA